MDFNNYGQNPNVQGLDPRRIQAIINNMMVFDANSVEAPLVLDENALPFVQNEEIINNESFASNLEMVNPYFSADNEIRMGGLEVNNPRLVYNQEVRNDQMIPANIVYNADNTLSISGTVEASTVQPVDYQNLNRRVFDSVTPQYSLDATDMEMLTSTNHGTSGPESCNDNGQEYKNTASKKRPLSDDEDDASSCPICLDYWTNTGEHRICALKCGHLFGYKCVNKWLTTNKSCPTCKKKVHKNDIRYIYAKKLVAVDTSELDILQKQLDNEREEKNRIQFDLTKSVCCQRSLVDEIYQLKNRIDAMQNSVKMGMSNLQNVDLTHVKLYKDKSLEICGHKGCRVFDINSTLNQIATSMKSPNNIFLGYGIRKIDIASYKPLAFLPLHNNQIRDISYHPKENLILTVSTDKSLKVTDGNSNSMSHYIATGTSLWSCCWDNFNPNIIYIGTQLGAVFVYDLRNLNNSLNMLTIDGDLSPVISVSFVPSDPGIISNRGLAVCKLGSMWFFENRQEQYIRHSLSMDGPFYSMKYDKNCKHLLVSSRPNTRVNHARHTVSSLHLAGDNVECNLVYMFKGGGKQTFMSRSSFVKGPSQYIAAHEESKNIVQLWNINSGLHSSSVPAHEPVLDLAGHQSSESNFLIALTERKLEFFKFV